MAAEMKRTSNLSVKLKQVRADNKQLRESKARFDEDTVSMPIHSTMREDYAGNQSNSMLMTSMNTLSVASLNIPECKPAENEDDIDRRAFETWKELLEASMNLVGINDEATKMNVLKVKAGPKLLEVLEGTPQQASPDATNAPYSNAMKRLKDFFGSREYSLMQRQKFRAMIQGVGESDTKYVKRVIAAGKLCDFDGDKLTESVAEVLQQHALNIKVREAGRKLLRKGGPLTELVDKIRGYELDKTNEEIFAKTHPSATEATVAAVTHGRAGTSYRQRPNFQGGPSKGLQARHQGYSAGNHGYSGQSGNHGYSGQARNHGYSGQAVNHGYSGQAGNHGYSGQTGNWQNFGSTSGYRRRNDGRPVPLSIPCHRCTSRFHVPDNCHAMDKVCRNCNTVGHIERACTEMPVPIAPKRRMSEERESSTKPKKIATVTKEEEEKEEVNAVSDYSN